MYYLMYSFHFIDEDTETEGDFTQAHSAAREQRKGFPCFIENNSVLFCMSGGGWLSVLVKGTEGLCITTATPQTKKSVNRRGLMWNLRESRDMYDMEDRE